MFRDVPGCSGIFHVPGFIDDLASMASILWSATNDNHGSFLQFMWKSNQTLCQTPIALEQRELLGDLPTSVNF